MVKDMKSLRMSFVDEGGKPWTLTISNPMENISPDDIKLVSDNIINNKLVEGKVGFVKNFNGAVLVTRTERPIE
ncbi:MAG: DUF2922 domain-containing protein [Peptoniphilus harei]|nr:DUF2922 domain-containing protein [Peptoniphilus harei]